LGFVDDGFGYFIGSFRTIDRKFRFGRVAPTKVQAMHLKSLSEEAYQQYLEGCLTKAGQARIEVGLIHSGVGRRATAGNLGVWQWNTPRPA
jgi:hypothetical protein